ncbi:hypothetical protein [Legionella cardiaca]|uniref:Coiled-coil protein n=1 Tax=Legionella cardiaca TaxID=1071983 RepID=A0ABY8AU51_9GAMM|nr:hypothetical protein [Legionella cardiaca]WED42667.1 hypothetical protein PXX05_12275 [Legionella cardiaca]
MNEKLEQRKLAQEAMESLYAFEIFDHAITILSLRDSLTLNENLDYRKILANLHGCLGRNQWGAECEQLDFKIIYLADGELLSNNFTYFTLKDLNSLKKLLSTALSHYQETTHLPLSSKDAYSYKTFLAQLKALITSAKSISGVVASFGIAAELIRNDAALAARMPYCFMECISSMEKYINEKRIEFLPNFKGAAFQLEKARESLIFKLEKYLESRAVLKLTQRSEHYLTRIYEPIDRGFFYNTRLQDARIEVANYLLIQMQWMIVREEDISTPEQFLDVIDKAIAENERVYRFYGRMIDEQGELARILENVRQEFYQNFFASNATNDESIENYWEIGEVVSP